MSSSKPQGSLWTGGQNGSSDTDSDSSSSYQSEDEKPVKQVKIASRFAAVESDSESDDEKRVVRTSKDKHLDSMLQQIIFIRKGIRSKSWTDIETGFDKLMKAYKSASNVIATEGVPKKFIKTLVILNDFVESVDRADTKKMSSLDAKAYNRVKQNSRAVFTTFTKEMEEYRANPPADSDDEDEISDSSIQNDDGDSSDEEEVIIGRKGIIVRSSRYANGIDSDESDESDASSESDSEDSAFSSESESESDSEDEEFKGLTGRARWLKREVVVKSKDEKDREKNLRRDEQEAKAKAKRERLAAADANRVEEPVASQSTAIDFTALEKSGSDVASMVAAYKWTRGRLEEEVYRVVSLRGRKGAPIVELVRYFTALAEKSLEYGPRLSIPTLLYSISGRFDLINATKEEVSERIMMFYEPALDRASWKQSLREISTILSILESDPSLHIEQVTQDVLDQRATQKAVYKSTSALRESLTNKENEQEEEEEQEVVTGDPSLIYVAGDFSISITRMYEEYIKSFRRMDYQKPEYSIRISDEAGFISVCSRAFQWYLAQIDKARDAIRRDFKIPASVSLLASPLPASLGIDAKAYNPRREYLESLIAASVRIATTMIQLLYYKHDTVAIPMRIAALNADKRSEVSLIAATAAAQALEAARNVIVSTEKSTMTVTSTGETITVPLTEEAASRLQQQTSVSAVATSAGSLARALALNRGKSGYANAAKVVAEALVQVLSDREGGLMSGAAVDLSRNQQALETLADHISSAAIASAEGAGVDMGDLSTAKSASAIEKAKQENSAATIAALAAHVVKYGDTASKNVAVLCHVFHLSLHDRYIAAKDLFIMSKTQDHIANPKNIVTSSDYVAIQILYNRALAMLGIAAFRHGAFQQCHECLSDFCSTQYGKELFAQSQYSKRGGAEKEIEQEKAERRRLVPHHMQLNLELLDTCYNVSLMLLEVPKKAMFDVMDAGQRNDVSSAFTRLVEYQEKKDYSGPPDTAKECVIVAVSAINQGDWRKAASLIGSLRIWNLWKNRDEEAVRGRITEAIKICALETYLYTYSQYYDSLSKTSLCEMFDLPESILHPVVSRLISEKSLHAKWDQSSQSLVITRTPLTEIQRSSLEYAHHLRNLINLNAAAVSIKSSADGSYGDGKGDYGYHGYRRTGRRDHYKRY